MLKATFHKALTTALLFLVAGLLFMCQPKKNTADSLFTLSPFQTENGWGYRIHKQDTLFIEQPTIPGVVGLQGFKSEQQAKEVGNLVIQKLNQGVFPPSVSVEELRQFGVKL